MNIKKYSSSSKRWLQEHINDKYVKEAQKYGLRSRSWFKLAEIQQKDKILNSRMFVLDLGSAPGSWSLYLSKFINFNGRIIACDILPMHYIVGVDFLQGNFCNPTVQQALHERIKKQKFQAILSDMSPNVSGISSIDMPRSIYLATIALKMCQDTLSIGGNFLVKIFQGKGFESFLHKINYSFKKIKIRKLNSSRNRSREVYIVATGYKL